MVFVDIEVFNVVFSAAVYIAERNQRLDRFPVNIDHCDGGSHGVTYWFVFFSRHVEHHSICHANTHGFGNVLGTGGKHVLKYLGTGFSVTSGNVVHGTYDAEPLGDTIYHTTLPHVLGILAHDWQYLG
jgi:hypothetical protein